MKLLGQPFSIQNTDGPNWLVTWPDAATDRDNGDTVSFTVSIPRNAQIPMHEVQRVALKQAIQMLQAAMQAM